MLFERGGHLLRDSFGSGHLVRHMRRPDARPLVAVELAWSGNLFPGNARPARRRATARPGTDVSVGAAAPRTRPPHRTRRRAPRTPTRRTRARALEHAAHVISEPRRKRPEAAPEHDDVDVEQVHRRARARGRVAARSARLGSRAGRLLGAPYELLGEAARAAAGTDGMPGPPGDRLLSPTNVSRQPAEPHLHGGPAGSTVMWPDSHRTMGRRGRARRR